MINLGQNISLGWGKEKTKGRIIAQGGKNEKNLGGIRKPRREKLIMENSIKG